MALSHSPFLEKLAILLLDSNCKRGLTAIGLLWSDFRKPVELEWERRQSGSFGPIYRKPAMWNDLEVAVVRPEMDMGSGVRKFRNGYSSGEGLGRVLRAGMEKRDRAR